MTVSQQEQERSYGHPDHALWSVVVVLSLVGMGVTAYLSYNHYFGGEIACLGGGGCEAVQQSRYSAILGVPVALLGLGYYWASLVFGILGWLRPTAGTFGLLAPVYFTMSLTAALFSWYLTMLQASVIRAYCVWCLTSAACASILFALSVALLWRWLRA